MAVTAGDVIEIKLTRSTGTDTNDVKFRSSSSEVTLFMKKLIGFFGALAFCSPTVAATPPTNQEAQYITPTNKLINPGFENGATKWAAYADTAGTQPTDCTGGSPASGYCYNDFKSPRR